MYTLLKHRRLRWLEHVVRMVDGRIPKDLLYGERVHGNHPRGRPQLRHKDICKRDVKALGMDLNRWETLTSERSAWRLALHHSPIRRESCPAGRGQEAVLKAAKSGSWTGQIGFVFSVEGTVTLELASSVTLDTVPSPPCRAHYP